MNPVEIYVLCHERSAMLAEKFLEEVAPTRSPISEDYPFPEFVDRPKSVYSDPKQLIQRLEEDHSESYAIYWNVKDGISDQVMIFFTTDGGMIVGLGGPRVSADVAFMMLRRLVQGKHGYVTTSSCPPALAAELRGLCEKSTLTNLFEGVIRPAKDRDTF